MRVKEESKPRIEDRDRTIKNDDNVTVAVATLEAVSLFGALRFIMPISLRFPDRRMPECVMKASYFCEHPAD